MMRKFLLGLFLIAQTVAMGVTLPALTASRAEAAYLPGYFQAMFFTFPECANGSVKARIIENFNWADRTTFYRGVSIRKIDYESERAIESFGTVGTNAPIDRRYCKGRAWLSNGKAYSVYYRIERGMGFAGTGYKVEFCVAGYDPWRVYDGNCRVLRR